MLVEKKYHNIRTNVYFFFLVTTIFFISIISLTPLTYGVDNWTLASTTKIKSCNDPEYISEINRASNLNIGMANPAAIYCTTLGYDIRLEKDSTGTYGVCVFPDGTDCDEWSFYDGSCGQEHSYCARQGFEIRTLNDGQDGFSPRYSVCTKEDGTIIGSVSRLMGLSEKATVAVRHYGNTPCIPDYKTPIITTHPDEFSWRNVSGIDWTTTAKEQGSCGSCWAFATTGILEIQYNINQNTPNPDFDLSEEFFISRGRYGGGGSCCGGEPIYALQGAASEYGVPLESCNPFLSQNVVCDASGCTGSNVEPANCTHNPQNKCNQCSDGTYLNTCITFFMNKPEVRYQNRSIFIDGAEQVKDYISTVGPVLSDMYYADTPVGQPGGQFDSNKVFMCHNVNPGDVNHQIIVVGYNDIDQYWIVKNSFGPHWPHYQDGSIGDGFFKVGYGQCNIERLFQGIGVADPTSDNHQCNDTQDNDMDGKYDFIPPQFETADPQCLSPWDNSEADYLTPECSDHLDNDNDGFCDANVIGAYCYDNNGQPVTVGDAECVNPTDPSELVLNGPPPPPPPPPPPSPEQCNNGIDDDSDGYIDWEGGDIGCYDLYDTSEYNQFPPANGNIGLLITVNNRSRGITHPEPDEFDCGPYGCGFGTVSKYAFSGFVFDHWTENGIDVGNSEYYHYNSNRNLQIVAHFRDTITPQCRDSVNNNDNDNFIDYPNDPQCISMDDSNELGVQIWRHGDNETPNLNNPSDGAECNDANYCVANNICYGTTNNNPYFLIQNVSVVAPNEQLACVKATRSTPTHWTNLDRQRNYCEAGSNVWHINKGDANIESAFTPIFKNGENGEDFCLFNIQNDTDGATTKSTECCCGDDFGEFPKTGIDNSRACCDNETDIVVNGVCYPGCSSPYRSYYRRGNSNDNTVFDNLTDMACCLTNGCVFNGNCYVSGFNQYDFRVHNISGFNGNANNTKLVCSNWGNGQYSTWLNPDYYSAYCTSAGGHWNTQYGNANIENQYSPTGGYNDDNAYCAYNIGHWYENQHPGVTPTKSILCCCGDDPGEYYVVGNDSTSACCQHSNDVVLNNTCSNCMRFGQTGCTIDPQCCNGLSCRQNKCVKLCKYSGDCGPGMKCNANKICEYTKYSVMS